MELTFDVAFWNQLMVPAYEPCVTWMTTLSTVAVRPVAKLAELAATQSAEG